MGRGGYRRCRANCQLDATVKDDGGKLGGTLSGDPGEFALVDAKLDGNAFTFKVVVNEATYTVETTIDGKQI